ncbi:MAG: glycosyltransferase family 1 protein [Candidatus Zixiibacteriota bacterium]|nr:MAG: glycosyltransferase family 1 protein [candidate division Zixibacteria bacterium]
MKTALHPLNVAMVAACPFPTSQGSQVLIRELSEALVRRGHRVHVVTYHFGQDLPCPGVVIHRIPELFHYAKFRSGPEIRKPLLDLLLMRKLDQVVRRENIQVIHAHNYEAPVAAFPVRLRRKVPVVYHSHNTMSDEFYTYFRLKIPQALARGAAHLMDRIIPCRADFVIAINRRVAAFLMEQGVPPAKIKYIPPGIDFGPPAGPPNPKLRRRYGTGDGPLILYVGNLDGYQRLDLLLDALPAVFNEIPGARLMVATGSDTTALRAAAQSRGWASRLVVVANPSFAQVRDLMALGSVAVNPRVSWSGFPIKLLNYMAAGLPVVAFRGAAEPVISGETGVLVPAGDAGAFSRALIDLLSHPEAARRLGQAARRLVLRQYCWDGICADIERIYYRLLGLPYAYKLPVPTSSEAEANVVNY